MALMVMPAIQLGAMGVAVQAAYAAPVATQPPPPTLTGETLNASSADGMFNFPCEMRGESHTVTFTTSGVATGPYPGTFTETATVSYTLLMRRPGPVVNTGTVTDFSATFTITTPTGTVTGTQVMDQSVTPGTVYCYNYKTAAFSLGDVSTTYMAIIHTPTGNYRDDGTASVGLGWRSRRGGLPDSSSFATSFTSALTSPVLIVPTSKEDCKHDGWQDFPQFENQGKCVSFVTKSGPEQGP